MNVKMARSCGCAVFALLFVFFLWTFWHSTPASADEPPTGTGIELVGRSDNDLPPNRFSVLDKQTGDPVAVVKRRWGFTPLPPGEYSLTLLPQGHEALAVPWADVRVEEGEVAKVEILSGIEVVGRSEDDLPPDRLSVLDKQTGDAVAVVHRRWGFTPLPPGEYSLTLLPQGYEALAVPWGNIRVEERKVAKVEILTGVELVGRSENDLPPHRFLVSGKPSGEPIAVVHRRWGFTPLPPGEYSLTLLPQGYEALAVPWGDVRIEEGKVAKAEIRSGIELIGRNEDDLPPDRLFVADKRSGEPVAVVHRRWGFTPLPPGEYSLKLLPQGHEALAVPWGDVRIEEGKVTKAAIVSGIELVGRSKDEVPPDRLSVLDKQTEKPVAVVYRRWGFTPLPPGEYSLMLLPQGHAATAVSWGDVAVAADQVLKVEITSGIRIDVPEGQDPPERWYVLHTGSGKPAATAWRRWGYTALPPGTYDVELRLADVTALAKNVEVSAGKVRRLSLGSFGLGLLDLQLPRPPAFVLASGVPLQLELVRDAQSEPIKMEDDGRQQRLSRWMEAGDVVVRMTSGPIVLDTPVTVVGGETAKVDFDAAAAAAVHGLSLFNVRVRDAEGQEVTEKSRVVVQNPAADELLGLLPNPGKQTLWLAPAGCLVRVQLDNREELRRDLPVGRLAALSIDFGPPPGEDVPSPVRVDVVIETPEEGTIVRGDRVTLTGRASTSGPAGTTRIAVVIDVSGSATALSGADVDGDGTADSVLAAEMAAGRLLVDKLAEIEALTPGTAYEVALLRFSSDTELIVPLVKLTHPRGVDDLKAGLTRMLEEGTMGSTNYESAFDLAVKTLNAQTRPGPRVILFLSDGAPSEAVSSRDPTDAALDAAARAGQAEIAIHTIGLGSDFQGEISPQILFPPRPQGGANILATVAALGSSGGSVTALPNPADVVQIIPKLPLLEVPEAELKEVQVTNVTTGQPAFHVELLPDGAFQSEVPVSLVPLGTHSVNTLRATAIAVDGVSQASADVRVRGVEEPAKLRVVYEGDALPTALLPSVELILDSSGSMAELVESRPKIEIAREVMQSILKELPDEMRVGLRLYGHWGTYILRRDDPQAPPVSPSDPRLNTDSQLVVPLALLTPQQRNQLQRWLKWTQPRGHTPMVYSLLQARNDFPTGLRAAKTVVLVSDGIETCGGKLEDIAAAYRDSGIDVVIHVVGFDVQKDAEAKKQLEEIASLGGGNYYNATGTKELTAALRSALVVGFELRDESGQQTVARGVTQGPPLLVKAGRYQLRLQGSQTDSLPVQLVGGELLEVAVGNEGELTLPTGSDSPTVLPADTTAGRP